MPYLKIILKTNILSKIWDYSCCDFETIAKPRAKSGRIQEQKQAASQPTDEIAVRLPTLTSKTHRPNNTRLRICDADLKMKSISQKGGSPLRGQDSHHSRAAGHIPRDTIPMAYPNARQCRLPPLRSGWRQFSLPRADNQLPVINNQNQTLNHQNKMEKSSMNRVDHTSINSTWEMSLIDTAKSVALKTLPLRNLLSLKNLIIGSLPGRSHLVKYSKNTVPPSLVLRVTETGALRHLIGNIIGPRRIFTPLLTC